MSLAVSILLPFCVLLSVILTSKVILEDQWASTRRPHVNPSSYATFSPYNGVCNSTRFDDALLATPKNWACAEQRLRAEEMKEMFTESLYCWGVMPLLVAVAQFAFSKMQFDLFNKGFGKQILNFSQGVLVMWFGNNLRHATSSFHIFAAACGKNSLVAQGYATTGLVQHWWGYLPTLAFLLGGVQLFLTFFSPKQSAAFSTVSGSSLILLAGSVLAQSFDWLVLPAGATPAGTNALTAHTNIGVYGAHTCAATTCPEMIERMNLIKLLGIIGIATSALSVVSLARFLSDATTIKAAAVSSLLAVAGGYALPVLTHLTLYPNGSMGTYCGVMLGDTMTYESTIFTAAGAYTLQIFSMCIYAIYLSNQVSEPKATEVTADKKKQ